MQFKVVNNKEILVFRCMKVHDGVVCLTVSGFICSCTELHRSCSLRALAIYSYIGRVLFGLHFLAVALSISVFLIFPRCLCMALMAGLRGLLLSHGSVILFRSWLVTVEAPAHPGSHLPLSLIHLLNKNDIVFQLHLYPLLLGCGHCKALAPTYEKLGEAFAKSDDVVIAKVDADGEKSLGSRFDVSGYPTLKYFPKGSTSAEE